ncbi:MAG: hypothetical protein AAGG80_02695, partial [Pseudomonadota bacterium]
FCPSKEEHPDVKLKMTQPIPTSTMSIEDAIIHTFKKIKIINRSISKYNFFHNNLNDKIPAPELNSLGPNSPLLCPQTN